MTQKVIANIYKRQITKTYNENGEYVCNFILEYRDEKDERHLMNVFVNNFEPYIDKDVTFYLAEVEVYSIQNVKIQFIKFIFELCKVHKFSTIEK